MAASRPTFRLAGCLLGTNLGLRRCLRFI
jgi:hypothetical protein